MSAIASSSAVLPPKVSITVSVDESSCRNATPTDASSASDDVVVVVFPTISVERLVPTDGGFGWLVVAATFLISFLTSGFLKTFSAFDMAIYNEFPNSTTSEAALITGLIRTVSLVCSPLTGLLISRVGCLPLVFAGGLLCSIGLGVSFFVNSSWIFIGSLALFMGIGTSFVTTSSKVCVGRYFTTRRPTAMAFALSGGCVGAMCFPTALKSVLAAVGLRYTFLALAGAFLMICFCSLAFGAPENRFRKEIVEVPAAEILKNVAISSPKELRAGIRLLNFLARWLSLRFFADAKFLLSAGSIFAMAMCNPHFLHYLPNQAKSLGVEEQAAMMLLAYTAVGDLVTRLSYGVLACHSPFTRSAEYTAALAISATSVAVIPFCTAYWHLVVASIASGVGIGMYTIIVPLLLSSNHGAENLSSTLTWVRTVQGCAYLLFPCVANMLSANWGQRSVFFFLGSQASVAAILSLVLHITLTIRRRK